ncbi:NADP-dependent 3-hydroxy acid dehydrogenase YdfG [Deinococcus reticulitermitis]|uniref:NADP-dependent 3-hydroxy acid dehydrogenase YdfG n=1 Tax=Deinococcus reticulitermitis TaxID=856736 RepID=A0A1H6ZWL7_9DEIO|nr:SDR family oxidoreductase [Deinococcus reticulitermitis]SEJ53195.1 NADP-dependent 3-hydroxy acid dehydrogenase YdfG [Deinococcus reticulitermitis]
MDLKDKTVVITGAASGIGLALAQKFVQEGARVVASDLSAERGQAEADRLGVRFVPADVGHEEGVQALIGDVLAREGRLDVLCSNAGLVAGNGFETQDRLWDLSYRVNFMSHVWGARHALPHMLERGSGALLQTVSAAGLLTEVHSAPYAIHKHQALALAEWLAITYGDRGIGVSALCPEWVQTPLIADAPHLQEGAITAGEVAEAAVSGLRAGQFLITTHPHTVKAFQIRAHKHERWLGNVRTLSAQTHEGLGGREAFPDKHGQGS